MKFFRGMGASLAVLVLLTGCSMFQSLRPQPDDTDIPPPIASPEDLQSRMGAANGVSSVSRRDSILKGVAKDAAAANELELMKQALNRIEAHDVRDVTTADCALQLGRQGRRDVAVELAGQIIAVKLRDQTLGTLASGR